MNTTVTLDSAGRVVIPKPLRDELGLVPGDTLALESDGERVSESHEGNGLHGGALSSRDLFCGHGNAREGPGEFG
ncbi:MAG: AbrB/MazE/SpoVT family DNA-binding domain-containing protein [Gammaproteobacteria bacterium]|nr:MAG: AbrB/MazE/SpoVT family DNA-binding domain-containing protein [Gammaproteobacteria bacterium]